MAMEARFWGTRGSTPSPGPRTIRYGGNTSCLEVRGSGGGVAILDAGTGIRALAGSLPMAQGNGPGGMAHGPAASADIFITHAHWDHIQGLPFFAPLFDSGSRVRIWTAPHLLPRVERALRAQMAPDVFPVPFEEVRATVEFLPVPEGGTRTGDLALTTFRVRHPGGAVGFRVNGCNGPGGALVYIPDNELYPGAPYDAPADWRSELVAFLQGADVLIHDSMYTAAEYPSVVGWGHSSVEDAVGLAAEAGVPRLLLFHHHPGRDDDAMDALLARARECAARMGGGVSVEGAAEGEGVQL